MAQTAAQKARAKELRDERKRAKDAEKMAAEVADRDVTSAEEWLAAREEGTKLLLPSGHVCLAVNPGIQAFVAEGLIPNSLMPIVQASINDGKGMTKKDVSEITENMAVLEDTVLLADRVLSVCVKRPSIALPPYWTDDDAAAGRCQKEQVGKINKSAKTEGVLYADDVDLDDKFFILQWVVGGTRDLERFRSQQTALVGDVAAEQDVEANA